MSLKKKGFKSLKIQVLIFMAINVLVWFLISEGVNEYIWFQEEARKLEITNALFTGITIFQVILFVVINIPFVIYLIRHIDKPVQNIVRGLRKIKNGNFEERIDFQTNNEFDEIKNEINIMSSELEKSSRLRKEMEEQKILLFANMAHDLKTPITSIQGFSEALKDGLIDTPEKQAEYINTIYSKATTMNNLIERLFEYVKINSDLNTLNLQETDIAELLRNCVSEVYTEFENHDIQMEINIPENPVIKSVDKIELHRVYTNLLNNVIAHNNDSIRCLIKMEEDGNVIIADSGNVIPTQYANQLFQPFAKGDTTRKTGTGSGLGLSLSKKIMEKHGGDLLYLDKVEGYTKGFEVIIK